MPIARILFLIALAAAPSAAPAQWNPAFAGAPARAHPQPARLARLARVAARPADAWSPADPADSLWRLGQRAIADESFERAASLFATIVSSYPKSDYAGDALYWRAYALYHVGGRRNTDDAIRAIERQARDYPKSRTRDDAQALRARILAERASAGDRQAAEDVARSSQAIETSSCKGDDDMRQAALSGLLQMDEESALPILKDVLARRDGCSEALRRQAVFIVSQKGGDDAASILLQVARSDPSRSVRAEAVAWLGQTRSDRAIASLDSIASSATDETMLDKAIFGLSQSQSDRGRTALRRIAGDAKRPLDARKKAVFWLGQAGGDEQTLTFFRDLFRSNADDELRSGILQAVAQRGSTEALRWLLAVAGDSSIGVESRKSALFWAGQNGADVRQLVQFYDTARGEQELQRQAIFVLSQRHESEATDKLMGIASKDPDREMRKQAIFWLGQRKDPRIAKFLLDLINQ